MGIIEDVLMQGLALLAFRMHVETCKECGKKYMEIVEHMKKEALKKEQEAKEP